MQRIDVLADEEEQAVATVQVASSKRASGSNGRRSA
jgi:hypothetical protein